MRRNLPTFQGCLRALSEEENGVRNTRVWREVLALMDTVVDRVEVDDGAAAIVVAVRPRRGVRGRCGRCGQRSSPGMTVVGVDGVGEHSMPAQPGCSLRLTRRGELCCAWADGRAGAVGSTQLGAHRQFDETVAGSLCGVPRRRAVVEAGGVAHGGSDPHQGPQRYRRNGMIASPGCVGSGSLKSPTNGTTST